MRKFALAFIAIFLVAPAAADDLSDLAFEPFDVAQLQGPSVIRAPRYVTDPNEVREPRNRNARRQQQPRHQQADEDAVPRHYARQQPPAQFQPQPQYHAPQERPVDLGGGFIEFLVTGNSSPRQRVSPPQTYYLPPQQQHYRQQQYYQQQPMQYERQAPAYREPLHVARTDPQEQPPRPQFDPRFERTDVEYKTDHPAGTIIIDTRTRYLYLVQPNGRALRYGVGVGRPGFEWKGVKTVSAMKEWPDWRPPAEMRKRQPYLPEHMPGGPNNPLGARALYLGSSLYRIHGSNEPHTIGSAVSSGCFRMRNQDVIDLYNRVKVGARVVVL